MAGFSPQQQAFIRTYSQLTGLHPGVVSAQVAAEEPVGATSGYHGTQDWLNVGITDSGPRGANNPAWRDPVQAAKLAAAWATGKTAIPGFGHAAPSIVNAIRSTAGRSPQAQIAALQGSGWASSGYANLPSLFNTYGRNAPGGGGALPTMPATSGAPTTKSVTTSGLDQAAFNAAQARYIAGSYLQNATDPYSKGQPSLVPTGASSNPLITSGALLTKAPDPANYQTAHTTLQRVAGGGVVPHPGVGDRALAGQAVSDASAAGANKSAQKLLRMLNFVVGAKYNQGNRDLNENEFQIKAGGTDCSGLISWLMGPQGLGIWHQTLATPAIANAPGLQAGRGRAVTIYNNKQAGNAGHVFIGIQTGRGVQYFASEGGGVGIHQLPSSEVQNYLTHGSDGGTYQALHPKGL